MMAEKREKDKPLSAVRYQKTRLLKSECWKAEEKRLLTALLEDEAMYTHEEARVVVHTFLKRRVV
ncbi:hypothetical protein [Paenibacillus chungangensis]|uniref:Uncharacterized protein n=1 Tax=Paenibacillus chungangensis TaxID=696535 RepID=A0ABW3HQQ5_9BACL